MRDPLHCDAIAVARVLVGTRPERRKWVLMRLFREADLANGHFKRRNRAHPFWGDGSLMSAALSRRPAPEPALSQAEYCRCLSAAYQALATRGR